MILIDSSVWLSANRLLNDVTDAVDPYDAAVCGPIVYEVLRGASSKRYAALQDLLYSAHLIDDPMPTERYDHAALIYRTLRAQGVTIRSPFDCVIAAVALSHDVPLLHVDRDFDEIAVVFPLRSHNLLRGVKALPS